MATTDECYKQSILVSGYFERMCIKHSSPQFDGRYSGLQHCSLPPAHCTRQVMAEADPKITAEVQDDIMFGTL